MPLFSKGNINVYYFHVPKTGGTSIARKFIESGWTIRKLIREHLDYKTVEKYGTLNRYNLDLIFMTCRHPFNRLVSSYHHWNKKVTVPISHRAEESIPVTFEEFIEFIKEKIGTSYRNNHLKFQKEYYGDKVQHIYKLETFDKEQDYLKPYIPGQLGHYNKNGYYDLSYDISEFEPYRKQIESLYREDMDLFGYN